MKKISNLVMMALLTVGMGLTSCEDILGHWEKPTPVTPVTPSVPVEPNEIDLATLKTNYTAKDGNIFYGTPSIDDLAIIVPSNATITLNGINGAGKVNIRYDIADPADFTIKLQGTNSVLYLDANEENNKKTITIEGDGKLVASAEWVGIIGDLIVNSGTVIAKATKYNGVSGDVMVNGGVLKAKGGTGTGTESICGIYGNLDVTGGEVYVSCSGTVAGSAVWLESPGAKVNSKGGTQALYEYNTSWTAITNNTSLDGTAYYYISTDNTAAPTTTWDDDFWK